MTDTNKESCPTKTALLSDWQTTTEAYSKAVAELSYNIGTVPKSEYEKLSKHAEKARRRSFEAKANLESHARAHGCYGKDGEAAA